MQLSKYLEKHKISQEAFANKIGSSQAVISAIMSTRRPGYALARLIEEATGGEVKFEELIFSPEYKEAQPSRSHENVLAGI